MLRVDLRDLRRGPVETVGRLEPDDPAFEGLDLGLTGPAAVEGRIQATGPGEYFWRGRVEGDVRASCRRCLVDVPQHIDTELNALFSDDPDAADDPSVYPLPPDATAIDLATVVREELALAVSPYPLCREDCAGLCPRCGADRNAGACQCAPAEPA
ncbi:MAG TPA: DUF177 domain-containing protein [Gemmatimonadales bacterium]|nr:DUF177 domain-containing protein [Gemmatimonadales bacterium]